MNFTNANAINFSYLLIEFYKKIELSEDELVVVLVIDHLISQNNSLINSSSIALNMNFDEKKVDDILAKLYEKKLIEILLNNGSVSISLEPLKKNLYKKFEESILSGDEIKDNEKIEQLKNKVCTTLEGLFNRSLTPLEINRVNDWLQDDLDENIISEALKEAVAKNYHSINQIDKSIIRRIRQSLIESEK